MAFKFDSNTPIVDSMGRPSPELLRVLNRWLLRSGGGSTAEPSMPDGLAYSMDPAGVRLSCNANPAAEDIIGYEWRYGSTWDTASVISPLGAREIVWNNNAPSTYTVLVKAENIRGIYSPAASMVVVVTDTAMGIYGPEVNLTYDRIAFLNQKNGAGVSPAQINFTANTLNLSSPTFQWKVDGVVQIGETASTFALPSFDSGSKVVRCDASSASLGVSAYDQYTVWVVNEGDDAYSWTLTNEDQAISVDSGGTPVAGLPATGTFAVARGSHGLGVTGAVTFSVASTTNATASIDSLTGSYSVTAISADTASVTFQAVVTDVPGGPTLQRTMTLHKSYPGATGATGPTGSTGPTGPRGSLKGYGSQYGISSSSWSDTQANAVIYNMLNGTSITSYSSTTHLVLGDTVQLTDNSNFVQSKFWSGSAWTAAASVIEGNLLVNGSGTFTGDVNGGANINISGSARFEGATTVTGTNTALVANYNASSVLGSGQAIGVAAYSSQNGGSAVQAIGLGSSTTSAGLYASSQGTWAATVVANGPSASGLQVQAWSSTSNALTINYGTLKWGSYTYAMPAGGSTTFMRNDGNWADPLAGYSIGNGSGQIAVSNGVQCTNLYASDSAQLAGYSIGNFARITGSGTGAPGSPNAYLTMTNGSVTVTVPCIV